MDFLFDSEIVIYTADNADVGYMVMPQLIFNFKGTGAPTADHMYWWAWDTGLILRYTMHNGVNYGRDVASWNPGTHEVNILEVIFRWSF